MLQTFCEFSPDYPSNLRNMKDPLNIRLSERIIQFPFAQPIIDDKTEEEVARLAEKRKEQGRKLQEIAARSRQEKVSFYTHYDYIPIVLNNLVAGTKGKGPAVHAELEGTKGI